MKTHHLTAMLLITLGLVAPGWATATPPPSPTPEELAPGVWLIAGGFLPDREPDGNTLVVDAPAVLVVVDTGRHDWHREAILALAHSQGRKMVAIVNTHWHLDHVSGNPALRAAFPELRIYASEVLDGALGGFLAASAVDDANYVDDPLLLQLLRSDIRADMLAIAAGAKLRPDELLTASGTTRLGGRALI